MGMTWRKKFLTHCPKTDSSVVKSHSSSMDVDGSVREGLMPQLSNACDLNQLKVKLLI